MGDSNSGNRLIFVGGAPRSGTTLVQNMLDSHPDICGGPEFLHIQDFINLRRKLHLSISREYINLFCSYDQVDRHINSLIQDLLLPLADKQVCEFLSEKTPENVLVFSELIELFPQAHFINVIRDPRAIVSSMQQVRNRAKNKDFSPPAFTANISASIAYVRKCFDAGFTASKNPQGKVITVCYETLILDPEGETKKICKFLGLGWSEEMITPGKKEHLGEKAITRKSNEIWYDAETYRRDPDRQDIEKWKKKLALPQQVRISMGFEGYKELKQFGYDFSINSLVQPKQIFRVHYIIFLRLCYKLIKFLSLVERRIPGVRIIRRAFFSSVRF